MISVYIIICAAVSMTALILLPKPVAPLDVEAEVAVAGVVRAQIWSTK